MDSNINTSKKEEKDFKFLIKTLRNEKSLFALEDMIDYIKSNIDNLLQNKIITFKDIGDLFFFYLIIKYPYQIKLIFLNFLLIYLHQ